MARDRVVRPEDPKARVAGLITNQSFVRSVEEIARREARNLVYSPALRDSLEDNGIPQRKVETPRVFDLPINPQDGDEVYLAYGTINWHMRYGATLPGPYKWAVVGGSTPLRVRVNDTGTTTSVTYTNLLTGVSPLLEIPLPTRAVGVWDIEWAGGCSNNTVDAICAMSFQTSQIAAVDSASGAFTSANANQAGMVLGEARITVAVPGEIVNSMHRVTAGTGSFFRRWMKARPVLLGRPH